MKIICDCQNWTYSGNCIREDAYNSACLTKFGYISFHLTPEILLSLLIIISLGLVITYFYLKMKRKIKEGGKDNENN